MTPLYGPYKGVMETSLYKRIGRNVEYTSISSERMRQSYEKVDMEMVYMEMFP